MSSGSERAVELLAHLCSSCSRRAASDADMRCGAQDGGPASARQEHELEKVRPLRHAPSHCAWHCGRRFCIRVRPRPPAGPPSARVPCGFTPYPLVLKFLTPLIATVTAAQLRARQPNPAVVVSSYGPRARATCVSLRGEAPKSHTRPAPTPPQHGPLRARPRRQFRSA